MENYKIIKNAVGSLEIYDPVRRKYVALTPEEKIRQHTINFLNKYLKYPYGSMGVECGVRINKMFFRTDIIITNKKAEVVMIVECKQEEVTLTKNVEQQVLKYFRGYPSARFLLLANGMDVRCWKILKNDDDKFSFVSVDIPFWNEINDV
ncbi:MAG: type I restriction enzyme HsdR N-terminal domain-containing protein [Bacteroidales bacterium]|nr:type I restriction enzyme HsdR N-terminal domain-containing protein [Bacteroidales bacterium]